MFGFLREDSYVSTMRTCCFIVAIAILLLLLSVCYYVIRNTNFEKDIDFSGISLVLGASGALITGALFTKAKQKKTEKEKMNGD